MGKMSSQVISASFKAAATGANSVPSSALMQAVSMGNLEIVKQLLAKGADINPGNTFNKVSAVMAPGGSGHWNDEDMFPANDNLSPAEVERARKMQEEKRTAEIEKDISVFTKGLPKPLRMPGPFRFNSR